MNGPVLIMAGGTGGHVFPALAVARVLRAGGHDVVWLGTRRRIEARLVPAEGIPIEWIDIEGLRGRGLAGWFAAPIKLLRAVSQALAVIRRVRPAVAYGGGGFASGPGGLAAWLTRTPLVIHEQNAAAGLTNRTLARLAGTVAEAFPGSFPGRRGVITTGNPVRREIAGLPAPEQRFAGRSGPLQLLVFGGSQGAGVLNRIVPRAIALLPVAMRPLVLHQAGAAQLEETTTLYRQLGLEAEVRAFIDDMAAAYGSADLAITRAGTTVSELAAAGLGALLVPLATAMDDHQTSNASFLVAAGGARMIPESELTAERLARELVGILEGGREVALGMAHAARAVAVTDAAERLAGLCVVAAGSAP
ncbi:MAG: undecaprenyldiphospho-muramoylpentapeptide beta-N-acetylglucosaminyltransferase [Rubrivivax sp.]|jgi:UDP-N-acetylglucosamine--N-acetylmuramyl-(pentapeptide) pyrophosphoryl-undecaprenol N-acetylglucosamine transferase|nr:undecaprenyldiphospho-muramoylpentapeptide beta-N-acetylglucosaminyltransferase [Rubrivivax sp.]